MLFFFNQIKHGHKTNQNRISCFNYLKMQLKLSLRIKHVLAEIFSLNVIKNSNYLHIYLEFYRQISLINPG